MRKTFYLFLLISFLCIGLIGQISQAVGEDELVTKARHFLDMLNANNYKEALLSCDEGVLKSLGPEKLAELWKVAIDRLGVLKKQEIVRKEQQDSYNYVFLTCEFEKQALDFRVTFNKEKHITGFVFLPPSSGQYQPPSYSSPDLFEEKKVTVGSGEWLLPGTLTIPKGNGPFPAIVLVHGSGSHDRDETVGANKPFKDLAWGLASRGFAVLRYEKRTLVYGSKLNENPKLYESFTVRQESIEDALAAVKLLKSEKTINPQKIVVLGHSLGGLVIPRIAGEGKDLDIAGFVIMAGAARKMEDIILEQTKYIFNLDGTISAEEEKQITETNKVREKIKTLKKIDSASGEKFFMIPAAYWLDLNEYEPVEVVKEIRKPILVLQGGRDFQVTSEDFENWKKALANRNNTDFKFYPLLNHLFFEGAGKSSLEEYFKNTKNVAEYVINDIATWMKKL